jgi:hypothetical protein
MKTPCRKRKSDRIGAMLALAKAQKARSINCLECRAYECIVLRKRRLPFDEREIMKRRLDTVASGLEDKGDYQRNGDGCGRVYGDD